MDPDKDEKTTDPFPHLTPEQDRLLTEAFNRLGSIFGSFAEESKKHEDLLDQQVQLRGAILTYHLVLENLLAQELDELRLQGRLKKTPKGFAKKLEELFKTDVSYRELLLPPIEEFNQLRNNLAHELHFAPALSDIPLICACVKETNADNGLELPGDVEGVLRGFLKICIFIFTLRSGPTGTQLREFQQHYPRTKGFLGKLTE